MPRFAANLTLLFTEFPLIERAAAAARAGFDAVEILWPNEAAEAPEAIGVALDDAGLPLALINTPRGQSWGSAALSEERFAVELERTLALAEVLRPAHIHLLAGLAEGPAARATYLRNLAHAAARAPGQSFTIEPISPAVLPGYHLADFDAAAGILAEIGAPNLHLQFDAFHAHGLTGDVSALWRRMGPLAAHVQIAGAPGRHEPAGGEIDYPAFFRLLDATGYAGLVSAEYNPRGRTEDGLGWLRAARG